MHQHVVITGGSRGLGLTIVRRLLESGYSATSLSRTESQPFRELRSRYEDRLFVRECDLSQPGRLPEIVGEVAENHGIFGLINNAALASDELLVTMSGEDIQRLLAVNLLAPLLLSRLVARQMIRGRGGRIVNISSIAAKRSYRGLVPYAASKAGLEAMTRTLAAELGPREITVNAVAPGFLSTEMTSSLTDETIDRIRRRTPLGELVSADDVASAVLFLLSRESRHITGAVIPVDGGAGL